VVQVHPAKGTIIGRCSRCARACASAPLAFVPQQVHAVASASRCARSHCRLALCVSLNTRRHADEATVVWICSLAVEPLLGTVLDWGSVSEYGASRRSGSSYIPGPV
jgi:hypothetical protein